MMQHEHMYSICWFFCCLWNIAALFVLSSGSLEKLHRTRSITKCLSIMLQ